MIMRDVSQNKDAKIRVFQIWAVFT